MQTLIQGSSVVNPSQSRRNAFETESDLNHPQPRTVCDPLMKLIHERDISLVFDIGAGTGSFASKLRHNGYIGRIVSFEPRRLRYAMLHKRALDDRDWETVQCALGDHDGIIEIDDNAASAAGNVMDGTGSLPKAALPYHMRQDVVVSRISTLLPAFTSPDENILVHANVPGAALRILSGARSVRNSVSAFHMRIPLHPAIAETSLEEVTRTMKAMDFECTAVVPFEDFRNAFHTFSTEVTFVKA